MFGSVIPQEELSAYISISYLIISVLLFFIVCYRESVHLHALNLAAEYDLRGPESRYFSRVAIRDRRKGTIFVLLLAITFIFYWSFVPIFVLISLLFLSMLMGATSMVFLHDMGEKEEILERVAAS